MSSMGNNTVVVYGQWGLPGLSAFIISVFSAWILAANLLACVVVFASRDLRNSRESILIVHTILADLLMGVLYGPLTVNYFVEGYWNQSCDLLFVYTIVPFCVSFFTVHGVGLLNIVQLLGDCCRIEIRLCTKRILFCIILVLLWVYFVVVYVSFGNLANYSFKLSLSHGVECVRLFGFDAPGVFMVSLIVYWLPGIVTVILLVVLFIRARKDLYAADRSLIPFKVYAAATAVSCIVPLPAFVSFLSVGTGICTTHDCRVMNTIALTFLMMKSGIMPCIWFIGEEMRDTFKRLTSRFRRGHV